MLTPEEVQERRESTIDIMAICALDGMDAAPEVVDRICSFVAGNVTPEEAIARAIARYAQTS